MHQRKNLLTSVQNSSCIATIAFCRICTLLKQTAFYHLIINCLILQLLYSIQHQVKTTGSLELEVNRTEEQEIKV